MSTKPNLAAALTAFDHSKRPEGRARATDESPAAKPRTRPALVKAKAKAEGGKPAAVAPSRQGKKPLVGYFDPAVVRQFKQIVLDEDVSGQELMREAINDLFAKYRKSTIA